MLADKTQLCQHGEMLYLTCISANLDIVSHHFVLTTTINAYQLSMTGLGLYDVKALSAALNLPIYFEPGFNLKFLVTQNFLLGISLKSDRELRRNGHNRWEF